MIKVKIKIVTRI